MFLVSISVWLRHLIDTCSGIKANKQFVVNTPF